MVITITKEEYIRQILKYNALYSIDYLNSLNIYEIKELDTYERRRAVIQRRYKREV